MLFCYTYNTELDKYEENIMETQRVSAKTKRRQKALRRMYNKLMITLSVSATAIYTIIALYLSIKYFTSFGWLIVATHVIAFLFIVIELNNLENDDNYFMFKLNNPNIKGYPEQVFSVYKEPRTLMFLCSSPIIFMFLYKVRCERLQRKSF